MNDSLVTLQGYLGGDVRLHETGDTPVAHFRVGSTPRWVDRRTGQWVDGTTVWYSVTAWRGLARNCADSLRRGDPVAVHGRLPPAATSTTTAWRSPTSRSRPSSSATTSTGAGALHEGPAAAAAGGPARGGGDRGGRAEPARRAT